MALKLVEQFGLKVINQQDRDKLSFLAPNLLDLIEYHRGLEEFNNDTLDKYYLYTGRGPSNLSFHIGHLIGLNFILNFQEQLKNKIFFMISDDEKMLRDNISYDEMSINVNNTIEQLRKLGFNESNTHIYIGTNGISSEYYKLIIKMMCLIPLSELNHIFGEKKSVGEYFYVFCQLVPCFLDQSKQCIVIAGIDQDPFFRLARNIASKLNFNQPIVIYTKNIRGLDGGEKMSTSDPSSNPIFINDNYDTVKNKIMAIKKVGAGTLDELFATGCNLDEDLLYMMINIFDGNRDNVNLIAKSYSHGLILDSSEHNMLKTLINEKGIKVRENKVMITSYGVRLYLTELIYNIIKEKN